MSSDSGAFYCSWLWPARLVTYMEAMETAEESRMWMDHFTVLPLRDGDVGDAESDLEDVPDDLENEDGFEAAGEFEVDYGSDEESESGDVDPNPEPSRKRVRRQDIPRSRKRASFDVPLDDADLQTYLVEEFPYLPTQSPFRIWSEIFPSTLVDQIVEQTNLYAHRDCNFPAFSTGRENISSFLGVLLLSGYHHLPEEDHYWSKCEDLGIPIVSKAMRTASFRHIKRRIHFADNHNLEKGNKIAKVAPVYTSVNTTLAKFGVFHEDQSIDESTVPYFGRHSAKMFIRGKPIRFGYVQALEPLRFGRLFLPPASLQRQGGNIQQRAPRHEGRQSHRWSCSGEFWCCKAPLLLRQLLHIPQAPFRLGIRKSESYRHSEGKPDRRSKPWFDVHQRNEKEHAWNVRLSLWWNRLHVQVEWQLMISRHCCKQLPNPHSSAWSAKACERTTGLNVQQPHLIHAYNQGMGGVDLTDRMLASYRPSIRGKKWYWPLFTDALNVTVVAAWRIHCKIAESPLSHLNFRREIAICLLKMSVVSRLQVGGGPRVNLPDDVRFDGEDHEKVAASQGRCKVCKKIAVTCVQSATCGCTMTAGQDAKSPTTCEVDSHNNSLKSWRFSAQWSSKTFLPTSVWLEQNKFHLNLCVETPLSKFFVHTFLVYISFSSRQRSRLGT